MIHYNTTNTIEIVQSTQKCNELLILIVWWENLIKKTQLYLEIEMIYNLKFTIYYFLITYLLGIFFYLIR